jgi:alkylation response protein AidB-like acyl-CoA dehydrogenase
VTRGALVNACATEPELGSPSRGGRPKTTARPAPDAPDAWIIDGRKSFASMAPVLDYFIIPATLQDGSDDVARFVVPRGDGIQLVETWDALGMRTTGSHDILLTGVRVPAANILARASQSTGGGANAWFLLVVSAVYVGVALAAQQAAACYAQERVPTALGRPIATLEPIQRHLGQAELLLTQARLLLYHAASTLERPPGAAQRTGADTGRRQSDGYQSCCRRSGSRDARGRRRQHDPHAAAGTLLPRRARRAVSPGERRRGLLCSLDARCWRHLHRTRSNHEHSVIRHCTDPGKS